MSFQALLYFSAWITPDVGVAFLYLNQVVSVADWHHLMALHDPPPYICHLEFILLYPISQYESQHLVPQAQLCNSIHE